MISQSSSNKELCDQKDSVTDLRSDSPAFSSSGSDVDVQLDLKQDQTVLPVGATKDMVPHLLQPKPHSGAYPVLLAQPFPLKEKKEKHPTSHRKSSSYKNGVRTADDARTPTSRALDKLQQGNERFVGDASIHRNFSAENRRALATHGQNPFAAVIGCADSRCPIEILFDVQPGDIFVLRNAGNTLTHAEGSMVGSVEYCVLHLGTKLVLVLGHTQCGAIAGATKSMLDANADGNVRSGGYALDKVLSGLEPVAAQAQRELQKGATADEIAACAVKVNVFNSMEKLLAYSEPLRNKVRDGEVEIHGAIYDIHSGRVEFLGQSPNLSLTVGSDAGNVSEFS